MNDPHKMLRLTIEVPDLWADDLDESAGYMSEPDPPTAEDRLYIVTEEWMRQEAVLTICTLPGEKCMNDDFELATFKVRIVGAETTERES